MLVTNNVVSCIIMVAIIFEQYKEFFADLSAKETKDLQPMTYSGATESL